MNAQVLPSELVLAGRQMGKPTAQMKRLLGGFPTPMPDAPVSVMFLLLFCVGGFLHMNMYKANSKRGHKFLISGLMFDFCMVRVVTFIFRILWAYIGLHTSGVVLVGIMVQNGGAVVISAINLFFVQRLIRAMHPSIGWHPAFSQTSLLLIWSCPAVTMMNLIAGCINALVPTQEKGAETVLKIGGCWNMMLAVTPLVWLFMASAKPGPTPENFGVGDFRAKASLLVFGASLMTVGAAVRLAVFFNQGGPDRLFSKATLYITQFVFELLIVFVYAFFRIDQIYHIPNGSSGPGDYSANSCPVRRWTPEEIEREVGKLGIRYEILTSRRSNKMAPVFALLYPSSNGGPFQTVANSEKELPGVPREYENRSLPQRPRRVSRLDIFTGNAYPEQLLRSKRTAKYMEMTPTVSYSHHDYDQRQYV
ncbi:uncharacterized protein MAM_07697 [Metarhizium album ARSEF 1941]|uniref:Uncharacterized protein n=1 Tax=Metarhizium album (strain ARSEF 1941) TaxID=1081103 RepID=A0A0B2WET7_METAS|nr:uncharacterized protein MAM_07697 [Metarhizium album ARSEF 1941]KHN94381.1 hypothetical protein MAM_07697 [Metarhizium album ARSEF 1941]